MKRRVTRARKFFGVLRWFSALLMGLVMIFGLHIPTGSTGDDILIIRPAEALTQEQPDTVGVVPLVHTTIITPEATAPAESIPEETIPVETLPPATEPQMTEPPATEPVETEPEKLELEDMTFERLYTEEDVIALAQMAWGEALVTKSDTEIAATMWCVLNRYDCGDPYYANCGSIVGIIRQPGAFHGYSARNPIDDHLVELARDVLDRWSAEKAGYEDVGRVLPAEYLYFHGDGRHNHFRIQYRRNGCYWDWSLESPYET